VPELPDITVYLDALAPRVHGHTLERVDVVSPFVLRSWEPPLAVCHGKRVTGLRRLGKRIVIALHGDFFLVIHLMIAGRLQWQGGTAKPKRRSTLAAFVFDSGTLVLTEAGTTRRASLHVVRGEAALQSFDRGGLEVLEASEADFAARLTSENHTVKRALADPRLFSGIGNAYSDEILHRARLSPLLLTARMTGEQVARLYAATRETLLEWIARLRRETGGGWPEKVTAFREGMAVHGRFRQPCPTCGEPVQRIRYADNETNYCARCQTGGRLLADRGLSRLLKDDWPRSLDEMEELMEGGRHSSG
jgi:formamidopyrimidine-DNA glycosylase